MSSVQTMVGESRCPSHAPRAVSQLNSRAGVLKATVRVAHILRKYNPAEWGGTETAMHRLVAGLREHDVESTIYCPRLERPSEADPLAAAGCTVRRFHSFLPVVGLSHAQRLQQVAVGGNLMSIDLLIALWRQEGTSVFHTHALGRLGAIAMFAARRHGVPLVVTIHGGYLDLPLDLRESFRRAKRGWEWGKVFGFLLRSRHLLQRSDAILTCNPREAALLRRRFPGSRVIVHPHGIPMELYTRDHRNTAVAAFPQVRGRKVLLCAGRIDPVKNQRWLVEEMPTVLRRHPNALLVLAGASTDPVYSDGLRARIRGLGLEGKILLTGGLPPGDPRLIGLFQGARVVLLPSVSETFGLVLLEAWASGTPVISSRTSGASSLIKPGVNGWLFDLDDRLSFHETLHLTLRNPGLRQRLASAGKELVAAEYAATALAGRLRHLYDTLIQEKVAKSRSLAAEKTSSGEDPIPLAGN